jgi:hypothetical protein
MLKNRLSKENINTVGDYILANKRESNVGLHIVKLKIQTLVNLPEVIGSYKEFRNDSTSISIKKSLYSPDGFMD